MPRRVEFGKASTGRLPHLTNVASGAHEINGSRRHPPDGERPYRWSQRYVRPVGTIDDDGGRTPEIYVANGEWQPLNAR